MVELCPEREDGTNVVRCSTNLSDIGLGIASTSLKQVGTASTSLQQVGITSAYMSTQREVLEGQTGSHRAKRANFGRGVRGSSPGNFQKPTWQMVQSTLFLSYICEYY